MQKIESHTVVAEDIDLDLHQNARYQHIKLQTQARYVSRFVYITVEVDQIYNKTSGGGKKIDLYDTDKA